MAIKQEVPCLLVIGFRPSLGGSHTSRRTRKLRSLEGATLLTIGPLDEAQVEALVTLKLGGIPAPEDFREQIAAARGSPLIISELIRLWRHKHRLVLPDGGSVHGFTESGTVSSDGQKAAAGPPEPETAGSVLLGTTFLSHVLRSRLDSTSMEARLAVKTAAVIGDTVRPSRAALLKNESLRWNLGIFYPCGLTHSSLFLLPPFTAQFALELVSRICPELSPKQLEAAVQVGA